MEGEAEHWYCIGIDSMEVFESREGHTLPIEPHPFGYVFEVESGGKRFAVQAAFDHHDVDMAG